MATKRKRKASKAKATEVYGLVGANMIDGVPIVAEGKKVTISGVEIPVGVSVDRSAIVDARRERLRSLRYDVTVADLVPSDVRRTYAEIWRGEQLELERAEHEKLHRTFKMRLRRAKTAIVDMLFGPPPPYVPTEPKFPFEG